MELSLFAFVGLALVYGVSTGIAVSGVLWLSRYRQPWRLLPFLCVTLTFVFMTQHPFPSPGSLHCPVPTAAPQLHPMKFLETFWRLGRHGAAFGEYLTNHLLLASAMNFFICSAIGLTLVRLVRTWAGIALFGALLTLSIELTQLTGIWGLYPCAYRQFNVDDLLLNLLGVLAGAAVGRARAWR